MDTLQITFYNLLTPPLLFFILGIVANYLKSDLEIPKDIASCLSIYLMTAIGFKGGIAISNTALLETQMFTIIAFGMLFSFTMPFIGYWILNKNCNLDQKTAAAVAAHYGSVSVVTFVTAVTFLDLKDIPYASYMVAILAAMEAPAILTGLFLAKKSNTMNLRFLLKQIASSGSILILFSSFLIGLLCPKQAVNDLQGFFVTPFHGILVFFLLEMGLHMSKELRKLKQFSIKLAGFSICMPILGAFLALIFSHTLNLNVGTGTLLMVLCASASYIAVSAAMRVNLPEAKASVYMPMTLGITFPFNILFGIPLYFSMASKFLN